MKITAKIVYGLQFLIHVAEEGDTSYVQIRDVVRKESISEKYLESIAGQLKSSGLLSVKRGAYGGYKLSKLATKVSLKEIFDTLEGLELVPDVIQNPTATETVAVKAIRELVFLFQEEVIKILSDKTLDDIVALKKKHAQFDDYQI